GLWEKAIALSPCVSLDYWKQLTARYADHLTKSENEDCVAYHLANGKIEQALQIYTNRSQFNDAFMIAQTHHENGFPSSSSSPPFERRDLKIIIEANQSLDSPNPSPTSPGQISYSNYSPTSPIKQAPAIGHFNHDSPPGITSEMIQLVRSNVSKYQKECTPVLSSACYLTIDQHQECIQTLIRSNEYLLAFACVESLKSVHDSESQHLICYVIAEMCIELGLIDWAIELLESIGVIGDWRRTSCVANQLPMADGIREKAFIKIGLQSFKFYASQADACQDLSKRICFYTLAEQHERAASLYCDSMKKMISSGGDLESITKSSRSIDATVISNGLRDELLAYNFYVAARKALQLGYYSVAPCFVRQLRTLTKNGLFDFVISRGQLDLLLCETYAHVDHHEAVNLLKQIIDSKTLTDAELEQADKLKLEMDVGMDERDRGFIPNGSNLPLRSLDGKRIKSYISLKEARAPLYLLDDEKSYTSGAEAMAWYELCPFSPTMSGRKLKGVYNL
ncbi:hypothetical protein AKO1_013750, partial [Acrasis kona]